MVRFPRVYSEDGEVGALPCSRGSQLWDTLDNPAALGARAVRQPELRAVGVVTPLTLISFNLKPLSSQICVGKKYKSLIELFLVGLMCNFNLYCYKERSNAGDNSDERFRYFRLSSHQSKIF